MEYARKLYSLLAGSASELASPKPNTPQFVGVTVCGVDYNGL
jgi:hypothetical protein